MVGRGLAPALILPSIAGLPVLSFAAFVDHGGITRVNKFLIVPLLLVLAACQKPAQPPANEADAVAASAVAGVRRRFSDELASASHR